MKTDPGNYKKIKGVLRNRFGLDIEENFVNFEVNWRRKDPERYDQIRETYREHFKTHPNREAVKKRFYIDEDFSIYLQSSHKYSELPEIDPENLLYFPICRPEEIRRIRPPKNASDYLLAMMANAIADSPRLKRIFLKRWEANPQSWSLSGYFDRVAFGEYMRKLPSEKQAICSNIPAHFGFLSEPNGACIRSPHGKVIVVSELLKVYLYYMNLGLLTALTDDFPQVDAFTALSIAVRMMLQLETPDFDLDPRGKIPTDLHDLCTSMAEGQLQFVIGHEYAHALLGHLDASAAYRATVILVPTESGEAREQYVPEYEQEFAADAASLLQVGLDPAALTALTNGATWFFLGLEILNASAKVLRPDMAKEDTHPDPISRIWRLRRELLARKSPDRDFTAELYSDTDVASWIDRVNSIKKVMLEAWMPERLDSLRIYGSIYFPTFRGPALIDRFDY
ncbi:hypothetical protein [uncultured Herbaspirillum sp.]|uniref:hypothetical protein n=1 Tax=uncultured Herbaspirillum sp. TaxID=160236 RepID=UPI0025882A91|nr:hypothetical protein [uncultured Herbaspirillum sp.]